MRVLLTIPAVGDVYGGPSKILLELAQSLGKQGSQVDLVTTNANGTKTLQVPTKTWVLKDYYRVQYFSCCQLGDYKFSTSLTKWCWQQLNSYDIVHTHAIFSLTNLPFYWICTHKNIPFLSTPHGMLEPWALSYKAWKKNIYYNILEKPALNAAQAIQATASTEFVNLHRLNLNSKLIKVPNGIDLSNFENLPDPNVFYRIFPHTRGKQLILFLGRLDPKKGLNLLAEAFGQVRQNFPNTHLIVAGPDNINYRSTVDQFFHDAGCYSSVTFTGMLNGVIKYAAFAAASFYIAPSYSEGFSISVLEGMAAGLPVVITTGCNFPEAAVAEAAQVVEISGDALAQALIYYLKYPEEAQKMGDRARRFVLENYSWEQVARQLINVYRSILDQKL